MAFFNRLAIGATTVAVSALLAGCGGDTPAGIDPSAGPPPAVTVIPVTEQPFAQSEEFVGKTEAFSEVEVRARVTGFLAEQTFTEGADVEEDALLFKIDPAEYQAAVAAATAGVERADAVLTEAQQTLERTRELVERETLPQSNLDEAIAAEGRARADVSAANADLEVANLNLGYTEVHAPIAGRIGPSAVDTGNLIGPDTGVLATVIDLDPIRVSFSLAERTYLEVVPAFMAGELPDIVPRIRLANGELFDQDGTLSFVDNQVDPNTGTVRVFIDFPNPDRIILPGQFVNVVLTSAEPEPQILIPQVAVQLNQTGPFVLVVDGDNRVELRQITTGAIAGADIVAESGLSVGEQIIVDGIQKVRPGGEVTVVPAANPVSG
ncbi:efflux RND transporter periplasmic adaptor subunit [Bauldia sp.]|uniref:efflux RND transporter periplasmic adaptor subunit n=1 Tax=Bauldia sp. TaxID=2575872 RepID=UPI003BA9513C